MHINLYIDSMNTLIEIYNKLRKLRDSGVKMKDIAEETDMTSSVLSSLYSTVLPAYVSAVSSGTDEEQALDAALLLVNNVSKKKLMGTVESFYEKLSKIEPRFLSQNNNERPFLDDIEKEAIKYVSNVSNYSGLYIAYSRSSYKDGLKIEPYLICPIEEGEMMPKVYCINAAGQMYSGVGIFSSQQIGYLLFNEQKRLQMGLKTIFLQLPMFEQPSSIRGLYLTHDYNRNPIARRIIFMKEPETVSISDFQEMRTRMVSKEELTETEKRYYDYTCQATDYVRSFMINSPDGNLNDLIVEKKILGIMDDEKEI